MIFSKKTQRFWVIGGILFLLTACGSGGSSGSGGTEVTDEDLKSLSSIPDIDLDALDAALASSTSSALMTGNSSKSSAAPETKEYSRAACEIRSCVDEFKTEVKAFQVEKCFLEAFEEHTEMQVGDGQYNYYVVTLDESQFEPVEDEDGEEGDDGEEEEDLGEVTTYVRAGVIGGTLNVSLCEPDEEGNYSQTLEMAFTVSDGKFDGTITDTWFDDDHQIHVNLATENPDNFSDGDEAALEGKFNGQWGAGHINVDIAKTGETLTNTVDASFRSGDADAEWGTWTSTVFGTYDGQEGCTAWSASGTYPAETAGDVFSTKELTEAGLAASDRFCWVENEGGDSLADFVEVSADGQCDFSEGEGAVECFWFELEGETLNFFVHENDTATYFDTVSANSDLMDFSEPAITFVTAWDCQAPSGFTEIAVTPENEEFAAAIQACLVLEEALDDDRDINSCEELEGEEDAEDEVDEEFGED